MSDRLKISAVQKVFKINLPPDFSFFHTVTSHGWYELRPFSFNTTTRQLKYSFETEEQGVVTLEIAATDTNLNIKSNGNIDRKTVVAIVSRIFRLHEAFDEFYGSIGRSIGIAQAVEARAGRLLRSATVWEDLIKTICTTNCSWAMTKKMVDNLVENLGEKGPSGDKAFPTSAAMAQVNADFYRDVIRAGYRSPYFTELAESVSSGLIDPESWLRSERSTIELRKELKQIKGVGEYAADNLLKLLGRYDGLALDSWLRDGFYKKHNVGRPCPDSLIESHYERYGEWRGLAIWCDMTESWFKTE